MKGELITAWQSKKNGPSSLRPGTHRPGPVPPDRPGPVPHGSRRPGNTVAIPLRLAGNSKRKVMPCMPYTYVRLVSETEESGMGKDVGANARRKAVLLLLLLLKCCFTSTETVGLYLLGTGAQDGHLD